MLSCRILRPPLTSFFFFFNDTATTEIYTLSLHDALPIFLGFPWLMSLDGAVRARPVLHDVATGQIRQARVPGGARFPITKGCGTPAHRIDVEPREGATALRPATIVVAHLELRVFTTATRIDARHHVGVGDTHHETNAPRGIGEHVGFHGFAAERSEERRVGKECRSRWSPYH